MRHMLLTLFHYLIAVLLNCYVMLVVITSKKIITTDKEADAMAKARTPALLFFWHNRIMLLPYFTKKYEPILAAVVSSHGDGEYVTKFLQLYNLKILRGSSRKASMQAAKQLIQCLQNGMSIAVTPDGPRGPRYNINSNAHKVAAKMGVPLAFACYSASRCIIVKSWDRFLVPLPFSTLHFEISKPIILKNGDAEETAAIQEAMIQQAEKMDKKMGIEI